MYLYNSATHKKEEFKTHTPGHVEMYTCGPTVYHFAHIGNLRSYIMEDVLEKYLRYVGYDVNRVMNITDVGHLTSDADDQYVLCHHDLALLFILLRRNGRLKRIRRSRRTEWRQWRLCRPFATMRDNRHAGRLCNRCIFR